MAGAAAAVLGVMVPVVVLSRDKDPDERTTQLPPATAKVARTTLVETKTVPGTLGYGDPIPVSATKAGTVTWMAPAGSIVDRGQPLFKVDEQPVVELFGPLPLYRPLRVGTIGADVGQLEVNLAALGYAGLTVDDTYTAGTATAVRTWQGDLGVPPSGAVDPGQVVFTPGPVRITEDVARVGDAVGGSTGEGGAALLSYTGTSKLVTVDLAVAELALAVPGRTVTVTVPDAGTVQGTIFAVGTTATANEQSGEAPGSGPGGAAGDAGSAADAQVEVTVAIADQAALGSLDTAPVDVDLTSDQRDGVLAVPVTALLALPDGGFGVEVVDGARTRIVKVETGLFASGQVEISGDSIAEGMTVGVAK
jgi:peptidoglycan hydrolase-like protein with peptidoglycan-binding domain